MIRNLLVVVLLGIWALTRPPSDASLRDRSTWVVGMNGTGLCSGVIVKAPSGQNVVLSAGHCANLVMGNKSHVIDNAKTSHFIDFARASNEPDLMVLTGITGIKGVKIAPKLSEHEHLRTFSHGGDGYDLHKAEGEFIQERAVSDGLSPPMRQNITTVQVDTGSSGAGVFNDDGELVGIVSTGIENDLMSYSSMVRLEDIKEALKDL